MVIRMLD